MIRLTYLLLLLLPLRPFAQKQGDVWFFGDSVFVDFTQGASPIAYSGTTLTSIEGCTSVSTPGGNLLLYSNGEYIYDSAHSIFANWVPDIYYVGNQYAVQGNLLLELNDSIVMDFCLSRSPTSGNHFGAYAARLNHCANNGAGIVEWMNVPVLDSVTEHMAAVRHADGRSWWILSHITESDVFLKMLVKPDGSISTSRQRIGGVHPPLWEYYIGQLVFDSEGDRFAIPSERGLLEIYDFDRCTGDISFFNSIDKPRQDTNGTFGISFSPDGKQLYASNAYWGGLGVLGDSHAKLFQYPLDSADLLANERVIAEIGNCPNCRHSFGHHKLGPDGKIYIIHAMDDSREEVRDTIMVIHNPNGIGAACNFDPHGLLLSPGKSRYGLPNIPDYRLGALSAQMAEAGPDKLVCPALAGTAGDSVQIGLPDMSGGQVIFAWTGPGMQPGQANLAQPMVLPSVTSWYHLVTVDTVLGLPCGLTRDSVLVRVADSSELPVAVASVGAAACPGEMVSVGVGAVGWQVSWSPMAGILDPAADSTFATMGGTYTVSLVNPSGHGACFTATDTVEVVYHTIPAAPYRAAGTDQAVCAGDSALIGMQGNAGWLWQWSPGGGLPQPDSAWNSFMPAVSGEYVLEMRDTASGGQCVVLQDTVMVVVEQPFNHAAPPALVEYCPGLATEIGVAPEEGFSYVWLPAGDVEEVEDAAASLTRFLMAGPAEPWGAAGNETVLLALQVTLDSLLSSRCRSQLFPVRMVSDGCAVQVVLTPNGDGVDDVLELRGHEGSAGVRVFDAAGRLVFAAEDYRDDWDGRGAAAGMYWYTVQESGGGQWTARLLVVRY